jgi:hypothetical protein
VLVTVMPKYSPSMMGLLCAPVLARVLNTYFNDRNRNSDSPIERALTHAG